MALTLGYWSIRGLGGHLRIFLNYLEVPFVDKTYTTGDEWFGEKFSLGFDFPNIPYLIDGDLKITQSLTILRYLGRKFGKAPADERQQVRVEQFEQEAVDLRLSVIRVAYDHANYDKSRADWLESSKVKLAQLDKAIGKGPWILGQQITYADFLLYDALDFVRLFNPGQLDSYANLQKFILRLEALPSVKAYIESPDFKRIPVRLFHFFSFLVLISFFCSSFHRSLVRWPNGQAPNKVWSSRLRSIDWFFKHPNLPKLIVY